MRVKASILLGALLIAVPLATAEALGAQTYQDRRVIDVLKDFQRQGVRLIFSTQLVRPDMWVIDEPRGAEARQIITGILAPHGLTTRVGARGVLMVIRASVARHPQTWSGNRPSEVTPASVITQERIDSCASER